MSSAEPRVMPVLESRWSLTRSPSKVVALAVLFVALEAYRWYVIGGFDLATGFELYGRRFWSPFTYLQPVLPWALAISLLIVAFMAASKVEDTHGRMGLIIIVGMAGTVVLPRDIFFEFMVLLSLMLAPLHRWGEWMPLSARSKRILLVVVAVPYGLLMGASRAVWLSVEQFQVQGRPEPIVGYVMSDDAFGLEVLTEPRRRLVRLHRSELVRRHRCWIDSPTPLFDPLSRDPRDRLPECFDATDPWAQPDAAPA